MANVGVVLIEALLIKLGIRYGVSLIKYIIYIIIGLLLIISIALLGVPQNQTVPVPLHCNPTGKTITVTELGNKLKGKGVFEGKEEIFIRAGQKHGVDPVLVVSIALHETGNGTSKLVKQNNNPGGLYYNGKFKKYDTLDEGIDQMTSNLARLYIRQGLTTPEQIAEKYAPTENATNDPTGLNHNWKSNVISFVNDLGGLSYECSAEEIEHLGPVSAGGFLWPLDTKYRITSRFGQRGERKHKGIDIGCTEGKTPIVASKSGTVVASLYGKPGSGFGGYGNAVLIDHGGGFKTLYAHLYSRNVKVGQTVAQGQKIGVCGNTGRSFGAHLHFEVRVDNVKKNPLNYVQK